MHDVCRFHERDCIGVIAVISDTNRLRRTAGQDLASHYWQLRHYFEALQPTEALASMSGHFCTTNWAVVPVLQISHPQSLGNVSSALNSNLPTLKRA